MTYGRLAVFGAVAALALLALACTTETTVLPPSQEQLGVTVTGSGSASGEPDLALLSLGVEAEAESVSEARTQAAEAMDAMLAALKDGGVDDEDLQTTRFSVQPRTARIDGRLQITGFLISNMVTAKIRNIDDTGELIDAALEAGGDLSRIENLRFTIDDPSILEDEARREAMAEAQRKAETLAQAGGVELGRPRTISETGGPREIDFELADAFPRNQAEFSPTTIELGELEIRVTVHVVYDLG